MTADHAVVIAGGGPTGMMLAGELALAGVDVVIVERRVDQRVDGSRAGGLHSRTIEVLDQRGIADRFLSAGTVLALRNTVAQLLGMDEPRRRIAGMMSALDVRYDLGEGHPLLGRRMPDLDLATAGGPVRVFELLHDARPVLLDLTGAGGFDPSPWGGRLRLVDARHDGAWELPVIGEVPAPAAVAIRPDGHVSWAGALTDPELPRSLEFWFGAPTPS